MGVRILEGGGGRGDNNGACLYCSVTMWAFGPIFEDHDQAQEFLDWLGTDPRGYNDVELRHRYHMFLERKEVAA